MSYRNPGIRASPYGTWLWALVLVLVTSQAMAAVHRLEAGQFSFSHDPNPMNPSLVWQPVTLPDNWDISHPDQGGIGWYRFPIELTHVTPNKLWAVYLPRLSLNAQVYLNGERIGSGGRFTEPIGHNSFRPLFFKFPAQLLHQGHNEIELRLLGFANESSGVNSIQIGPADEMSGEYQRQFAREVLAPTVSFMLLILLSLILFIIWIRRRHETVYLMFSLCGAFSSLYTAAFFIQDPSLLRHHQWLWLTYSSAMWYVYCVLLLIHRFVGIDRPLFERLMLGYTVLGTLFIGLSPPDQRFWLFGLLGSGYALVSIYVLYTIVAHRRQCLRSEVALLFCTLLFSSITGYHDLTNLLHPRQEVATYYFYWGSTVLGIAMAILLLLRFDRSLRLFETLNHELNRLVDQKTQELQQSFIDRQALETRQVVFGERERIMRDLHDGLGGYLVSALVQTEKDPVPMGLLQQTLRAALNDLRMMIDSLDTEPDDIVMQMGSLRERLEGHMESSGTTLYWNVADAPQLPNANPTSSLHLMRMIQEIFTNIAKHSRARHAWFVVKANHLDIVDDGIGFDTRAPHAGRGLPNLRQRAQQTGLDLNIQSSPQGTHVTISWSSPTSS